MNIDDRAFNIALELCITWVNRILFLKLLEAQIVRYQNNDSKYQFLNTSTVANYGDLVDLFFAVLAKPQKDRTSFIQKKYAFIPYLNSALFEETDLEKIVDISQLNQHLELPLYSKTVLKDDHNKPKYKSLSTLQYLFEFLDAYDFSSEGGEDIQEDSKTIINAAVLGLIFEKINGYKEGAIFTPGYITMYMSAKVIHKTVVEKFKADFPDWNVDSLEGLKNYLADYRNPSDIIKFNNIINNIKICDPAVGSGHFLVSCLNELIAVKSQLGILADTKGHRITDYEIHVDNDELIISHTNTGDIFNYCLQNGSVSPQLQHVQTTLFNEKQTLIENCLFGVDINANSVKICRLRLWIELLKNAYYKAESGYTELETLPNIDINIKCGNSLLSRYKLDENLSNAFKKAKMTVGEYRDLVSSYKTTKDKTTKNIIEEKIISIKRNFKSEIDRNLEKVINTKSRVLTVLKKQNENPLFQFGAADKKAQQIKLKKLKLEISRLEDRRYAYSENSTFSNAMEWRFEFPEVLDDKGKFLGFDIIIANPPYGVSLETELRNRIYISYGKVPDHEIYYMFLNLAYNIVRNSGYSSQIIPNTLLFNWHAKEYRKSLLGSWHSLIIDDLTDLNVFKPAVVRNIILTTKRSTPSKVIEYKNTRSHPTAKD